MAAHAAAHHKFYANVLKLAIKALEHDTLEAVDNGRMTTTSQTPQLVHIYLAFSRTKDGQQSRCMRQVIKDAPADLAVLKARCAHAGGKWRIHRTVNARDTEKARAQLVHHLIDHPECRDRVDSLWKTLLLKPDCAAAPKYFMLDVDTKQGSALVQVRELVAAHLEYTVETENGWHFVVRPHDTRQLLKLPNVTLLRDGYVYVETVGAALPRA